MNRRHHASATILDGPESELAAFEQEEAEGKRRAEPIEAIEANGTSCAAAETKEAAQADTQSSRPGSPAKKKKKKKKRGKGNGKKKPKVVVPPFEGLYEGAEKDGLRHGDGKLTWSNGDVFIGKFAHCYRSGQGKYSIERGLRVYVGSWRRSLRHGKGKETYADGSRYEGDHVNDMWHGNGVRSTSAGSYEGEFEKGMKHGTGKMVWIGSRATYTGMWEHGFFHGTGTYVSKDGTIYEGEWRKGVRSGNGASLLPNGEKYQGQWKNNVYHGVGIYRWSNGKWRKGEWAQGSRIRWLTNDRIGNMPSH
jgi:hypothetical protein